MSSHDSLVEALGQVESLTEHVPLVIYVLWTVECNQRHSLRQTYSSWVDDPAAVG